MFHSYSIVQNIDTDVSQVAVLAVKVHSPQDSNETPIFQGRTVVEYVANHAILTEHGFSFRSNSNFSNHGSSFFIFAPATLHSDCHDAGVKTGFAVGGLCVDTLKSGNIPTSSRTQLDSPFIAAYPDKEFLNKFAAKLAHEEILVTFVIDIYALKAMYLGALVTHCPTFKLPPGTTIIDDHLFPFPFVFDDYTALTTVGSSAVIKLTERQSAPPNFLTLWSNPITSIAHPTVPKLPRGYIHVVAVRDQVNVALRIHDDVTPVVELPDSDDDMVDIKSAFTPITPEPVAPYDPSSVEAHLAHDPSLQNLIDAMCEPILTVDQALGLIDKVTGFDSKSDNSTIDDVDEHKCDMTVTPKPIQPHSIKTFDLVKSVLHLNEYRRKYDANSTAEFLSDNLACFAFTLATFFSNIWSLVHTDDHTSKFVMTPPIRMTAKYYMEHEMYNEAIMVLSSSHLPTEWYHGYSFLTQIMELEDEV